MTPTTTNRKAPGACDSKGLTTDSTGADFPTPDAQVQDFKTLAAGFAQTGHTLHQTDRTDGAVTYWAARWGLVRYLPTIDAARRFLEQVGGRL